MSMSIRAAAIVVASAILAAPLPTLADEMVGTLQHLIASARTKADQERIAGIYEAQAVRDRDEAAKHRSLGAYYKGIEPTGGRGGSFGQMALHCANLADFYTKAADESTKLAEMHRKMAAEIK